LSALIPPGTASVLLSHAEGMDQTIYKRIAELEARKDWDGLAQFADENLKVDRNIASWWFIAGYAHTQAGRHAKAAECYAEVVRLTPDDILGSASLAQAYRDAKQPLRCVQTLNNAHVAQKGTMATYFLLGDCYSDLDRDLPAATAYREAIKLNEDFAQAWYGLGRASARLGRLPDYEAAMKALTRLDPARAKQLAELRPGPR
jgi:tetratricopeptide (TPR) repeat protein